MSRKRNFLQSLNDATEGIIYVVKQERNMRVHFLIAFFLLLIASWLGVKRVEWVILCGTVVFVLVLEMLNTAVEEIIDAIFKGVHSPVARNIKHISAGAVLLAAFNALVAGFLIFSKYWGSPFESFLNGMRYSNWHATFISLMAVLFIVVAGKAFYGHGTPFRGGAISGHAAVAFSLWTVILYTSTNQFVIGITLCMALLVAQSRLRSKIHSFWEAVAGALVGTLATALLFQVFRG